MYIFGIPSDQNWPRLVYKLRAKTVAIFFSLDFYNLFICLCHARSPNVNKCAFGSCLFRTRKLYRVVFNDFVGNFVFPSLNLMSSMPSNQYRIYLYNNSGRNKQINYSNTRVRSTTLVCEDFQSVLCSTLNYFRPAMHVATDLFGSITIKLGTRITATKRKLLQKA